MDMVNHNMNWTLVFEDFKYEPFQMTEGTNFLKMSNNENCCIIKNQEGENMFKLQRCPVVSEF